MTIRIFLSFSFIIICLCGVSQNSFDYELQKVLQMPEYKNASVGISIVDLESESSVFEYNAGKLLIPASILKIVTSAGALELLGADYRFKTQIGYVGEIKEKEDLIGDLVIIGGGDPTLGSEYFKDYKQNDDFINFWVKQIKAAGIRKINGDIVFDSSIYDSEEVPSTWIWGDIGNYYGANANPFTCYDNLFRITFKSPKGAAEPTQITSTYPNIERLEITNEVLSSDVNRDLAYVYGSPLDDKRIIRGTIPKNRNSFTIKAAIHHPEEILAKELFLQLAKEGIFISGEIKFQKIDKSKFQSIYIHESPELSEIIKVLNYESVNLFAEHLIKQIAAEKIGFGSREKGIEIIKEFWQTKGLQAEGFFMEDGSGLSHFNAISPTDFTSILMHMHNNSIYKDVFIVSLPQAGDGTLSGFSTKYFPGETLKAKSGSMTRVKCYAGYLQLDSGGKIAFSVMFNHFSGSNSSLTKNIENLLTIIRKSF